MKTSCSHSFEDREECPVCNEQNVADQVAYQRMKNGDGSDRSAVTSRPRMRNGVLTRVDSLQWSEAEWAIHDALDKVERLGSSTALTDAVLLLDRARGRVADHVEGNGYLSADGGAHPEEASKEPTLKPGWLRRDVDRAVARMREWLP